jgi:hypothetical protein
MATEACDINHMLVKKPIQRQLVTLLFSINGHLDDIVRISR